MNYNFISNSNIKDSSYNDNFAKEMVDSFTVEKLLAFYESIGVLTSKLEGTTNYYPASFNADSFVTLLLHAVQKFDVNVKLNCELIDYSENVAFTNCGDIYFDKISTLHLMFLHQTPKNPHNPPTSRWHRILPHESGT